MGLAGRATCVQMAAYSHQQTLEFDSRAADSPPCGRSRWSPALRARQSRRSSWCQGQSLDNVAGEETVTLINMDVEGAERQALEGCAKIIARDRPKMLIAAYHRSEDLFAIPLQIALPCARTTRFYLRHLSLHPCLGHQPLLCIVTGTGARPGAHFRA